MPRAVDLRIDPEVRPLLRVGLVRAEPVAVAPAGAELLRAIDDACGQLARRHAGQPPAAIPGLEPARALYRSFGIDPTRTRPSSEALLRRVLRGKPFPRVSNAVDVGNLCSILFLLPLGLYDARRIRGGVTLRRGVSGEGYPGIRKDRVNVGGRPALIDDLGPFGNPTSDSLRTSVTRDTRSLLMVIFAPPAVGEHELADHVATAAALMAGHLGGGGAPVETSRSVRS